MLVLSRKAGESLYIGDDIQIILLEQKGSKARIGIRAPKDVHVHREEVYLKRKEIAKLEKEHIDE